MTLGQLKELIEQFENEDRATEDTEVRIAEQPRYPLQSHIAGVATLHDAITEADYAREEGDGNEPVESNLDEIENVVYICAGSSVYNEPYANRRLWDVAEGA